MDGANHVDWAEEIRAGGLAVSPELFNSLSRNSDRLCDLDTGLGLVRLRFPLVIPDEAQDTNGAQLKLLTRVFGQGVVFQRLGDENQTLYEDPEISTADYWQLQADTIPLNETRRFGQGIKDEASMR
ncbi:MAG: UvrD-helicase domain-containing protein [Bradyrhizobium sp.]